MININGTQYKLGLLDTNCVSEMVKNPDIILCHVFEVLNPSKYIPCFSIFTILELRQRNDIYTRFLEIFSTIPCFILKSLDLLFQDEIAFYPNPDKVSPLLVNSPGILAPKGQKLSEVLELSFCQTEIIENENKWNSEKKSVLEGMLSLVHKYPPHSGKYTPKEIRTFIELVGFQQIAIRNYSFASKTVKEGNPVIIDAFPSIKMLIYNVFYKFYTDQRIPIESDTFDILIASALPYVDAFVTEKHQTDVIKRIKQQDNFINNLEVYKLKDFR